MKELDPVGGARRRRLPGSANVKRLLFSLLFFQSLLEGLISSVTKEDITRAVIFCLEKSRLNLKTRSRAIGVRVHQVVQIIDMDGLGKQHITFTGMYNKIRKKRFKPVNNTACFENVNIST